MIIKCKRCKTIIKGDGKKTLIACECGRCAIKESPFHYAIYGEDKDWKEIKDERYNKSIRKTKRRQTFFGINRRNNKKLRYISIN